MTSATGRQIRDTLWTELTRIYRGALAPLGGKLHVTPSAGLKFADGRSILGFSTDEAEKMAGTSSPSLLYIVDEASGVPDAIFEAIEGNRAGGAKLVMFSNPTQASGTFFEAFHKSREFWHTIHVSSAEAAAVDPPIAGLANAEWIAEKIREWGPDSAIFQVRAEGNFPTRGDNSVVAIGDIVAAVERWRDTDAAGRLEIGVDVARFGDDETVIQPKRGKKALASRVFQGLDVVDVAGEVLKAAREWRIDDSEIPLVKVDGLNMGAGVVDILRRSDEIELHDIDVGERATVDGFVRLRDQVWFATSAWLGDGGAIPPDPKLEGELAAPKYSFDVQGRQKVESKDEIKKRLKRSPDRADALGLAVYEPPPATYTTARGRSGRRSAWV